MIWKSKLESSFPKKKKKKKGTFPQKQTTSQGRKEFATPTKLHKEPCFEPKFPKVEPLTSSTTVCFPWEPRPKTQFVKQFGMGFPWTRNPNRVFPRKELGPKTWFIKQSSGQVKSLGQLNWGCHLVPFSKGSCSQCKQLEEVVQGYGNPSQHSYIGIDGVQFGSIVMLISYKACHSWDYSIAIIIIIKLIN